MTLKEKVLKLQTYKMFEGEDTVYVERDDILELLEQEPSEDAISRQAVINAMQNNHRDGGRDVDRDYVEGNYSEKLYDTIISLPPVKPQQEIGQCKDCKHFRKLPYHVDTLGNTLGRCFQHTSFYPKGDWYCADFESQESEEGEQDETNNRQDIS